MFDCFALNMRGAYVKTIAFGVLFIISFMVVLLQERLNPVMPTHGLDPSWRQGLVETLVQGKALGVDTVFTSSHLSFVYTNQYHPRYFVFSLLAFWYVSFVFVLMVSRVVFAAVERVWLATILVFLLVFISCIGDAVLYSMIAVGVYGLRLERFSRGWVVPALYWISMALLAYAKTSLAVCAVVIWMADVFLRHRSRSPMVLSLIFPAGCLAIWVGSGNSVSALYDFICNSAAISSGYGDAMGTPIADNRILIVYWVGVVAATTLYLVSGEVGRWPDRLVQFFVWILIAWFFSKAGFVRAHDGHVYTAVVSVCFFALLAVIYLWPVRRKGFVPLAIGVVLSQFVLLELTVRAYANMTVGGYLAYVVKRDVVIVEEGLNAVRHHQYEARYWDSLARLRGYYLVPKIEGDLDVYRSLLTPAFMPGVVWNPRLVFQSYSAYTPALIRGNVKHLLGAGAPENILLELSTIDGRFPAMDDGASLIEILKRYSVVDITEDYALYRRRDCVNDIVVRGCESRRLRMGGDMVLPDVSSQFVELRLGVPKSMLGKLYCLFYKAPPLFLTVESLSGSVSEYRIVAGVTSEGFILSPVVSHHTQFALLNDRYASDVPAFAKVRRIKVRVPKGFEWVFAQDCDAEIRFLELSRRDYLEKWSESEILERSKRYWARGGVGL